MKLTNKQVNLLISPNVLSDISICILFVLMLNSMQPWFFWNKLGFITLALSALFVLVRLCILSPETSKKNPGIILLSILVYFLTDLRDVTIGRTVLFFCHISVFFFAIQMKEPEKEKLIRWTTTLFAWIIGISMIFHILVVFFGITFSYSLIKHTNEGYPEFENYKILLMPHRLSIFPRFQSIFVEPGHIGMIASFILFVNKYKLKKMRVFVIFMGLLLSLSLAAYVLVILGYFIYQFFEGRQIYKKIILVLFVGILLGSIGLYMYNEYPDSPVTVLIVNRLQYDEEKGVTGNNRLTSAFDDNYYTKYFLGTSDMIWGIKPEVYQEKFRLAGNSYKLFFIRYGFIGIVSLFMFYFAMACSTNSRLLFGLFLLYCASFLQRTYALWEIELFLFVGASGIYLNSKESVF